MSGYAHGTLQFYAKIVFPGTFWGPGSSGADRQAEELNWAGMRGWRRKKTIVMINQVNDIIIYSYSDIKICLQMTIKNTICTKT